MIQTLIKMHKMQKIKNIPYIITGPPNGRVLFCSLASVVVCRL